MHLIISYYGSLNESDLFCIFDNISVRIAITMLLPKITVQTNRRPPDNLTKTPVAEKQRPANAIQIIAVCGESMCFSTI